MSNCIERHYRVKELAALWGYSLNTIANMFRYEPGVMKLSNQTPGKRAKVTLSIPESVVLRVQQRLSQDAFETHLARRNPLRIIHLSDPHGTMPKKPRNILNAQTRKQFAHGKRVA